MSSAWSSGSREPHFGCRLMSKSNTSCVSCCIGTLKGNLISALSAVKATRARGPALSQASFRAGSTSPNVLLGPRVGRFRSCARHSQMISGISVSSFSKGNPLLQNCPSPFCPFFRGDGRIACHSSHQSILPFDALPPYPWPSGMREAIK